jgi:hypothetical protein
MAKVVKVSDDESTSETESPWCPRGWLNVDGPLKSDPLYLVLSETLLCAVVELGRARALVRGHRLRMLERAAISEIGCDTGRAKSVIADRSMNARRRSSPADHAPGVRL